MKIGLEIEVPFRFYFPVIYGDFLTTEPYSQFSESKVKAFNERISLEEPFVVEKLTAFSNEYGLKRGRDKYWEFVFPPEDSTINHKTIILKMVDLKLLPSNIPTSLHITLSGVSKIRAFAILFFLELKFVDSERILSGFGEGHDRLAWNRKGVAGVTTKYGISLMFDDIAFELRTLMVKPPMMGEVLDYLEELINNENVVDMAKTKMKEIGLPFTIWEKEHFIKFSQYLRNTA